MSKRVFALLVGINDYSPAVGKLSGCLNDVDHFHGYLTDNYDRTRLQIEILKNRDATRPNIIELFRSHLGRAQAGDVAVFQYSGHGARWKSAKPFEQFYPGGRDEGLVCFDSRGSGGFDLADKELAVLLAELAKNDPHIWNVPPAAQDEPARLKLSVEVRTGYTTGSKGFCRPLKQSDWLKCKQELNALGGPCGVRRWEDLTAAELKASQARLPPK